MARGEQFKEKAGGFWDLFKAGTLITYGSVATAAGAAAAPNEARTEIMDGVKILDVWSGTWGKQLSPDQHPVRDQFFATGHDFFHSLSQDGFVSVVGALLFTAGVTALVTGGVLKTIGTLRIKSS